MNATWRTLSRAPFSTVPGVHIDIRDSVAIMKIPYISPVDFASMNSSECIDWGTWYAMVYAPLEIGASGAVDVDYSVYLHFENVELAAPIHPQSDASAKSFSSARVISMVGDRAKKAIADQEAEASASSGVVSRGLRAAAGLTHILEEVPLLQSIAGPVTWVLRGASAVASWFGFSKPFTDTTARFVSRSYQPYLTNVTGEDFSTPLSLYHDNSLMMRPNFGGTGLDEMNFNYLKKIPAYFDEISWASTQAAGTVVGAVRVGPDALKETVTYSTLIDSFDLHFRPPFSYLSQFFQVYRGSIDIHFKIVKTDYHSGRLAISFVPTDTGVAPTLAEAAYLLREIVDIRDKSEITLRIPYLMYQKFIGTEENIGLLQIRVLNELRAPETCSQEVRILLSASAGDDFEYGIPGNNVNSEYSGELPVIPQMGAAKIDTDQSVVSETIGNYPAMALRNEAAGASIGEKFTSVRQLLLKYSRLPTNAVVLFRSDAYTKIYPHSTAIPRLGPVTTGTRFDPLFSMDPLCILAHGYAFMRGSIRLGILKNGLSAPIYMSNNTTASMSGAILANNVVDGTANLNTYSFYGDINTNDLISVSDQGPGLVSVRVPNYTQTHSMAILPVSSDLIPQDVWNSYSTVYAGQPSGTNVALQMIRSIGEDFHLGYFLGFPPTSAPAL